MMQGVTDLAFHDAARVLWPDEFQAVRTAVFFAACELDVGFA
jgi:hypothetical protein